MRTKGFLGRKKHGRLQEQRTQKEDLEQHLLREGKCKETSGKRKNSTTLSRYSEFFQMTSARPKSRIKMSWKNARKKVLTFLPSLKREGKEQWLYIASHFHQE